MDGIYDYIKALALKSEHVNGPKEGDYKGKDGLWDYNQLSGIELSNVPLYFHPIPLETIQQSKGNVTNGYGLPQK